MDSFCLGYVALILYGITQVADTKEYCVEEFFEARCSSSEIIMIDSATYGRMELGKCVTLNLGYLGCHGDARQILQQWCSGKHICSKQIDDKDFRGLHNCPKEIHGYLEASYSCHTALQITSASCDKLVVITDQPSLISLKDLAMTGCGTTNSPLTLQAKVGQYFNITVLDFSIDPRDQYSQGSCIKRYGRIIDLTNNRQVSLCSGNGPESVLVLTNGNSVQLIVDHMEPSDNVLLQYSVIGCEELKPISGATMHRKGDMLHVECTDNGKAWRLQCQDNQWVGTYDECAEPENSQTQEETEASEQRINIPHELLIIAAGTVVLFVSGVIVCVGVLYLCNRRSSKPPVNQLTYGYTYNPRTHDVTMRTIQRPQIPDFSGTQQMVWARQEMPDVVDQTLTRTLPPPVPVPVMGESIYENPGQLTRGSGSCIYSSVHADNPDQSESDYSDSLKYYVLEQNEQPSYSNTT